MMRDCEMKRNMTNTGLEKHQSNSEQELPIVLLHGTSGQSEDWSQVVEQLTRHRPVIRLNYAEPVAAEKTISFRADAEKIDTLDSLAAARDRPPQLYFKFSYSDLGGSEVL